MNQFVYIFFFLSSVVSGQNHVAINYKFLKSDKILLYDNSNQNLENIVNQRNEDENSISTFEIGIVNFWSISKIFNIGAGLNFSRSGYSLKEITDIIWPSEITPQGYVFDPSLPHRIKQINIINYLELPIILEYSSGGDVLFMPYISLENQYYIRTLSRSKTDIGDIDKTGKDSNVNKYNLAVEGGLRLGYKFGDFVPTIGVFYNQQLLTAIKGDISEKFNSYGLNLTLKYII